MSRITVTITNWEKYNPRKDQKKPSWFRMSNDLLDHPDFVDFSPIEFHAMLYILSQASKRNCSNIELVFAHAMLRNVAKDVLISTLNKLEQIQFVQLTQNIRAIDFTDEHATNERTNERTPQLQLARAGTPAALFEFDRFAKKYPKPKGPKAEERFHEQIKTEQDIADLDTALKNYMKMLSIETWRKPKQDFATFLGTKRTGYFWRTFLDTKCITPLNARSGIVEA